ncbi:hypothetical protein OPW41_00155 [Vibrio europaeus]|nr:hypothetical protein [Vibrio europaeus]MDC5758010.1 hypothetical protein [Vibrio europaeus]MDC5773596.1 hypothetical protein [Vibrio europaeus]MDC5793232.1 hypothetical protein [Vibrio europaeus]MDC5802703.1 hypothetical protein [Vibrio europaeus]MDC5814653.1 hypothetical protein [Vibrio europaeus]
MQEDSDGQPKLGFNSKRLGVRIKDVTVDGDTCTVFDIQPDENGDVHPDSEGMSVTPPCVNKNIGATFLKRILDQKTVLWEIDESDLSELGLKYREDPKNPKHGFIEPANKMAAQEFSSRIQQTKELWRKSNDLQSQ